MTNNENTLDCPDMCNHRVLIIDDDQHFLISIKILLEYHGVGPIDVCSNTQYAQLLIKKNNYSAILLDISLSGISGIDFLKQLQVEHSHIPVIMFTGDTQIDTVINCIKSGAFYYLTKPTPKEKLLNVLYNAFESSNYIRNPSEISKKYYCKIKRPEIFSDFATVNRQLIDIFSYIEAIALSKQPVLITGETGTGKELIARAIHRAGKRPGAYVPMNIGGISESLIDDDLFGHFQGAFTGAKNERIGMVEQASEGTLFLDEIGDLPLSLQVKLLRFIQEHQYQHLGSDKTINSNARIVVATNYNIEERVESGFFRKDLYYRLNTHRIDLPPLRERKTDIPFLIDKFLEHSANELGMLKPVIPKQLITLLYNYDFPGNIRELQSMIYDAMSVHTGKTLSMTTFIAKIENSKKKTKNFVPSGTSKENMKVIFPGPIPTLKETQNLLIQEALRSTDGNQTIAARLLGMSRRALNGRISREVSRKSTKGCRKSSQ